MAENTKIEWAHHTFNPWIGCTKVSPGCDHCYAEKERATTALGVKWGANMPRHRTSDSNWKTPVRWNAAAERRGVRESVFCASLGDWADNAVPSQWRFDLADLILKTPWLDWLLLTKRIGNAAAMLAEMFPAGIPSNVWVGATICNQEEADRDIPKLLAVPAAKRFLSMEPLLGPVDLGAWIGDESCHVCRTRFYGDEMNLRPGGVKTVDFEDQPEDEDDIRKVCPNCQTINTCGEVDVVDEEEMGGGLHWVIVGGESGPNARPMHPDWARSLRDQCQAAGVPFLFKQWGEWSPVAETPVHPEATRIPGNLCKVTRDGVTPDHYIAISTGGGRKRYELRHVGKKAAGRDLDGRTWDEAPA